MASADIIDVLFVVPLHWIYFYYGNIWLGGAFGEISCKVIYFLVEVSIFASVLTLVVITMDRYMAICHMNYTPLSRAKTRIIVLGIWVGSCLLSTVQLYKFKTVEFQGQSYCVSTWNTNTVEKEKRMVKYEMTLKFALSYGIPLVLMIILNALIIRQLRRRLHSCVVEENQELQKQIAHQNRPLVEMFITLVTIFALCWFPVHVNHMLIAFDFKTYQCLPTAVPLVFYLLAHANAAINPLLYFIFISGFRNELKRKAVGVWNWATTKTESSTTSSWMSYFRSRSPSIRRRRSNHRNYTYQNNDKTFDKNNVANHVTTEPCLKSLDVDNADSKKQELSVDVHVNNARSLPDPSPPLPTKKGWVRGSKGHSRSYSSSRSLKATSYTNNAFDTGNNNMLAKSSSLPWKLSTFV